MSINYTTYYAMPHLPDYAAAAAHEAAVKPIRGDDQGRKPLGRRDQKWRRIKREADGSIVILDDYTDIGWYIRYTPDNELHLYDTSWSNKATHNEVLMRVTGLYTHTEAGRQWARYDGGIVPLAARVRPRWVLDEKTGKTGWAKPDEQEPEPTIFVKNERGKWECKNPPTFTTHQVSRKGAKAVRQRYATGLSYIKALASLRRDDGPRLEEITTAFRDTLLKDVKDEDIRWSYTLRQHLPPLDNHAFNHTHAAQIAALMSSEDPGDQYKAFLWLMFEAYDTTKATARADKVLMVHHHDEWFKQVEHEAGRKVIDRYEWAFPT
jgi:hypothetical protein